jgi:hypothetical protein
VLHPYGGVVGECLCAFAFTANDQFGYIYDGSTLIIKVFGAASPTSLGSVTGNLVSVDWSITEWQSEVITNGFSGTLSSGGFHQEILAAADATYVLMSTLTFDDGVVVVIRTIIETRISGAALCVASVGKGARIASLACNLINMDVPTAWASCGRIFLPRWIDSAFLTMGSGLVYNGLISEGSQYDFAFVGGLDDVEWSDLPNSEIFFFYSMKGQWCVQ